MAAHPAAGYIETDRRAGRDRAHGRVGRGSRSRGRGAPKQCSSCLTLTLPPLPLLRARGGIRDARDAVASQRYGRRRTGWQPAARAANRREVKREASTCADARARRSAALSWRDAGPRGRRTWPAPAAGDLTAPALSSPANKFRLEKPNREFLKTAWTEVEGLVHAEMHDSPRSGLCASADRRCCLKHIPVFNQRKIKGCRSRMINNTQRQSFRSLN